METDLRRAADIILIGDLIARTAQTSDHGTMEEYRELLDPDMVWEMPASPATGIAAQTRRGREDMITGSVERRALGGQGPGSATRHVVSTTAVDPDGDAATAVSYWRFYADTTDVPRILSMGVWRDDLVRGGDGQWRLSRRRVELG